MPTVDDLILKCTGCGEEIVMPCKYLVVSREFAGVKISVGCAHYTPPELGAAIGVFGGSDCAFRWFDEWLNGLRCDHQMKASSS
jgi:hypothetical protein